MLTIQDLIQILQLISSPKLTVGGNEVIAVSQLQQKLANIINEQTRPKDASPTAQPSAAP